MYKAIYVCRGTEHQFPYDDWFFFLKWKATGYKATDLNDHCAHMQLGKNSSSRVPNNLKLVVCQIENISLNHLILNSKSNVLKMLPIMKSVQETLKNCSLYIIMIRNKIWHIDQNIIFFRSLFTQLSMLTSICCRCYHYICKHRTYMHI